MQLNQNTPVPFWLAGQRWQFRMQNGKPLIFARFCGKTILLHRFVLPVEGNIRFADGNPLNVSKCNLITKKGEEAL